MAGPETNPPTGGNVSSQSHGHGQGHGPGHGHGHGGQGSHGQSHTSGGSTAGQNQQVNFHPMELKLKADEQNNYFLQPLTRGIPGFPTSLGDGYRVCLGLTPEGQSAVKYVHPEAVDPKKIYVRAQFFLLYLAPHAQTHGQRLLSLGQRLHKQGRQYQRNNQRQGARRLQSRSHPLRRWGGLPAWPRILHP
jgi:hypothetical protein